MDFDEWEPIYEKILADFGYPRQADEEARELLAELVADGGVFDHDSLHLQGETVAIAGAAACLEDELDMARSADRVFAASDAAEVLLAAGVSVDCMVTDLDKVPTKARSIAADGTPVAVHAHGDNMPALREFVPTFETSFVIPTTQAEPVDPVVNFGGFTDGDRAAFMADELGASDLVFPGWDFDDQTVEVEKQRKLAWAKRLLAILEERRNASFAVLDGYRSEIDTSDLTD
jgi:uncharacterized Rossmann fold enzyme